MTHVPTTVGDMADYVWKMEWSQQKSRDTTSYRMEEVVEYFGDRTPITTVDSLKLEGFVVHLRSKKNSAATINRKLAVISKILKYGVRHGVISRKPEIPKQKESPGRLKFYSEAEEAMLASRMQDPDLRDLFTFLIDTGMRRGEALSLRWQDVDLVCGTASLSDPDMIKNDRPRTIPLTARATEIMEKRRLAAEPLSPGPFPFTNQHIDDKIKEFRQSCKFDGALLHTCRHTFCSRLVQRGVPLAVVKELAGHTCLKTTLRYSHLEPGNLVEAISKLEPTRRSDG